MLSATMAELNIATETAWRPNPEYLLPGPLQEKCADQVYTTSLTLTAPHSGTQGPWLGSSQVRDQTPQQHDMPPCHRDKFLAMFPPLGPNTQNKPPILSQMAAMTNRPLSSVNRMGDKSVAVKDLCCHPDNHGKQPRNLVLPTAVANLGSTMNYSEAFKKYNAASKAPMH